MPNNLLSFTTDGVPTIDGRPLEQNGTAGGKHIYQFPPDFSIAVGQGFAPGQGQVIIFPDDGKNVSIDLDPQGLQNLNQYAERNNWQMHIGSTGKPNASVTLNIPASNVDPSQLTVNSDFNLQLSPTASVDIVVGSVNVAFIDTQGTPHDITPKFNNARNAEDNAYASASSSDEIRARLQTDIQMEVALARGTSEEIGGQAHGSHHQKAIQLNR